MLALMECCILSNTSDLFCNNCTMPSYYLHSKTVLVSYFIYLIFFLYCNQCNIFNSSSLYSNANSGGLSRSAEQLCERLSESGEISKAQGTTTLMRKSHKSGGTWGSISRVFARQKKRAALDTSIYDGKHVVNALSILLPI